VEVKVKVKVEVEVEVKVKVEVEVEVEVKVKVEVEVKVKVKVEVEVKVVTILLVVSLLCSTFNHVAANDKVNYINEQSLINADSPLASHQEREEVYLDLQLLFSAYP
jgi:hypothetical protein